MKIGLVKANIEVVVEILWVKQNKYSFALVVNMFECVTKFCCLVSTIPRHNVIENLN